MFCSKNFDYFHSLFSNSMKSIENEYLKMKIIDDILFIQHQPCEVMTVERATKSIQFRKTFTQGNSYLLITNIDDVAYVTAEARALFAAKETNEGILATAIVTQNPISNFISKVFISTQKTPYPIEIFNSYEDAKKWITQFK